MEEVYIYRFRVVKLFLHPAWRRRGALCCVCDPGKQEAGAAAGNAQLFFNCAALSLNLARSTKRHLPLAMTLNFVIIAPLSLFHSDS